MVNGTSLHYWNTAKNTAVTKLCYGFGKSGFIHWTFTSAIALRYFDRSCLWCKLCHRHTLNLFLAMSKTRALGVNPSLGNVNSLSRLEDRRVGDISPDSGVSDRNANGLMTSLSGEGGWSWSMDVEANLSFICCLIRSRNPAFFFSSSCRSPNFCDIW